MLKINKNSMKDKQNFLKIEKFKTNYYKIL